MTLSHFTPTLTGEGTIAKYTGGRDRPSREEIARLAYHFYETRGRQRGHDVDDWLSAERALTCHLSAAELCNSESDQHGKGDRS